MSDAKVDVVLQRIEEDVGDEVPLIPVGVQRYGINNIFQRTFSYLIGKTSADKYKPLRATVAGVLKVASVGAGLEKTERKTGVATDALSTYVEFTQIVSRIEVIVDDYTMNLYPSPDGVTQYQALKCLPGVRNTFDIAVKAFKVQRIEANDVEYNVTGAW